MTARNRWAQTVFSGAAALLFAVPLAVNHTIVAQSATRLVDEPAQHRLVATLDPTVARVATGGRMAHSAMLNRLRVEVLDSAGRPAVTAGQWEVKLFGDAGLNGDGATTEPIVRLSSQVADISVPRPWGYRLRAADSVLIVATLDEGAPRQRVQLRLTIDYDPIDLPASRMAVRSVHPSSSDDVANDLSASGSSAVRSWEWRPAISGEIVVITGLPLTGVGELVLQDVLSGEVLWRMRPPGQESSVRLDSQVTL